MGWLVSNQRYFGVPFPVWYCKNCNEIILADKKTIAC
jgi:valyl-tRNA synthetase